MPIPFFGPTPEESRANLFRLIDYKVYDEVVAEFHRSTAPHRFVSAPARTSKSYSAAPEIIHDFFPELVWDGPRMVAAQEETICWIVAVDYGTAKEWDYCWSALRDRQLIEAMGGVVEMEHNTPNQGNMVIRARWPMLETEGGTAVRSVIAVKSATNEKSLQGEEIKTCIMSEAAEHDERIFLKYLDQRCGRIIYPTTPKRKARWIWDLVQKGKQEPALGIEHFQYSGKCNPTYDWERHNRAKLRAELEYGDAALDPAFAEQFMGLWTFNEGKVLPFISDTENPRSNVTDHLPPWISHATWFVSMDHGYDDPACAHFWAMDVDGEMLLVSEIYERHLVSSAFAEKIQQRVEDLGIKVEAYIPDPQKVELTRIMRDHGLPIFDRMRPGELRDRTAGYTQLRDALATNPNTGKPRMKLLSHCTHTINEFDVVSFKDGHHNEFAEGSIIGKDHAIDSARYFVRSRLSAKRYETDWIEQWSRDQKRLLRQKQREQSRQSVGVYQEVHA